MDSNKYKSVALSIDTYNVLKDLAKKEDRTITGTIRHLIKKDVKKEKPSEGMR